MKSSWKSTTRSAGRPRAAARPSSRPIRSCSTCGDTSRLRAKAIAAVRSDVSPRLQTITGAMNDVIRDWLVRRDRSVLAHGADDLVSLLHDGMGRR